MGVVPEETGSAEEKEEPSARGVFSLSESLRMRTRRIAMATIKTEASTIRETTFFLLIVCC